MDKLIVILGPTASGKTDLSIKLAKKYRGEIVSADSRQVYQGLDIGSGKITRKEMQGIPHHLLDVVSPKTIFTVAHFQKKATRIISEIQKRNHVPFLVGGTGFYIQSVLQGTILPEVKPQPQLRKQLEKKSLPALFAMLKKRDPHRAATIDPQNPRRLIRAIEIVITTGKPVPPFSHSTTYHHTNLLQIGIKKSPTELKRLIARRLKKRLPGIMYEVRALHTPKVGKGLSWARLESLGLEYRFTARYLQGKISKEEMITQLQKEIEHFAKRQMTWFKKDKSIHWVTSTTEAHRLVKTFLTSKKSAQ